MPIIDASQIKFDPDTPTNQQGRFHTSVQFDNEPTPIGGESPQTSDLAEAGKLAVRSVAAIPQAIGEGMSGLVGSVNDLTGNTGVGNAIYDFTKKSATGWKRLRGADSETPEANFNTAMNPEWAKANPVKATIGDVAENLLPIAAIGAVAPEAIPVVYGLKKQEEGTQEALQNNPGMSEQEARLRATPGGIVEGGLFAGMGAAGRLGRAGLAKVAPKIFGIGETVPEVANYGAKRALQDVAGVTLTDTPYMIGQGMAIGATDKATGVNPNATPVTTAMEPKELLTSAGTAALFGLFHARGAGKQLSMARDAMSDPTADPQARTQAAGIVYDALKDKNPAAAQNWMDNTNIAIHGLAPMPEIPEGITPQPIPLDNSFLQHPMDVWGKTNAEAKTSSEGMQESGEQPPTPEEVPEFTPPEPLPGTQEAPSPPVETQNIASLQSTVPAIGEVSNPLVDSARAGGILSKALIDTGFDGMPPAQSAGIGVTGVGAIHELPLREAKAWAQGEIQNRNTSVMRQVGESQNNYNQRILDGYQKSLKRQPVETQNLADQQNAEVTPVTPITPITPVTPITPITSGPLPTVRLVNPETNKTETVPTSEVMDRLNQGWKAPEGQQQNPNMEPGTSNVKPIGRKVIPNGQEEGWRQKMLNQNGAGVETQNLASLQTPAVSPVVQSMAKQYAAKEKIDTTGWSDQDHAEFAAAYRDFLKNKSRSAAPLQSIAGLINERRTLKGERNALPEMQQKGGEEQEKVSDMRAENGTEHAGNLAPEHQQTGNVPVLNTDHGGINDLQQGETPQKAEVTGEEIPDHIVRAVEEPRTVSNQVGIATKQQTKDTLNEKLKSGEIPAGSPIRLTTVEELHDILSTGHLREGKDFEGRSGISAQVVDGKKPIVAYGPNDKISAAIVFPEGSSIGKGEQPNEVKVSAGTDPHTLRFAVDGYKELMSFDELRKEMGQNQGLEKTPSDLSAVEAQNLASLPVAKAENAPEVANAGEAIAEGQGPGVKGRDQKTQSSRTEKQLANDERLRKESRSVNPEKDDIAKAISKLGGINKTQAENQWGATVTESPAWAKMAVRGKPVFRRNGGLSIDRMAEALAEQGYLPTDEHGKYSLRDFEEAMTRVAGGENIYGIHGQDRQAEQLQRIIPDFSDFSDDEMKIIGYNDLDTHEQDALARRIDDIRADLHDELNGGDYDAVMAHLDGNYKEVERIIGEVEHEGQDQAENQGNTAELAAGKQEEGGQGAAQVAGGNEAKGRFEQTAAGSQGVLIAGTREIGKGKNPKDKGTAEENPMLAEMREREAEKKQTTLPIGEQNKVVKPGTVYGTVGEGETSYEVKTVSDGKGRTEVPLEKEHGNLDRAGRVQEQFALFTPAQAETPAREVADEIKSKQPALYAKAEKFATGVMRSAITRIKSAADAAHLALPLADMAQEHMIAIVTDKKGKVLGVVQHSTGSLNQSIVHPRDLLGVCHDFPGAAAVWLAHNHPTGDPTESPEDRDITARIGKAVAGSGLELKGHIIVGKDGVLLLEEGGWGDYITPTEGERKRKIPTYQRRILDMAPGRPKLTSPENAYEYLKKEKITGTGLLLMDVKNRPTTFLPMTEAEMSKLKTGETDTGSSRIMHTFHETNSAAMIAVVDGIDSGRPAVSNLVSFGDTLGAKVLDGIALDGESMTTRGIMPSGSDIHFALAPQGPFYSKLESVVESKFPGKADSRIALQMFEAWRKKGEFTADELEQSGIKDFLADEKRVTKQDVLDFLKAQGTEFQDVVLGGETSPAKMDWRLDNETREWVGRGEIEPGIEIHNYIIERDAKSTYLYLPDGDTKTFNGENSLSDAKDYAQKVENERWKKEKPEGDTQFSQESKSRRVEESKAKDSIDSQTLTDSISPILKTWHNAPDVRVVQKVDDLPVVVRYRMAVEGIKPDQVQAVFYDGKVHLVADNLSSPEESQQKLLHETVAHFGLRSVLDPESFRKQMLQASLYYANKKNAEWKEIGKTYGLDLKTVEGRMTAAEEMIAREAESGATSSVMTRIIAAVKDFARKLGFNLEMSDAEIREMIGKARRFVEGDQTSDQLAGRSPSAGEGQRPATSDQISFALKEPSPGTEAPKDNEEKRRAFADRVRINTAIRSLENAWAGVGEAGKGLNRAFNPMANSPEAKSVGEGMREQIGRRGTEAVALGKALDGATNPKNLKGLAKYMDIAFNSYRTLADQVFARMSDKENIEFITRLQHDEKQSTPELDRLAKVVRKMYDAKFRAVETLTPGIVSYRKNYFPHIWKDPDKAEDFFRELGKNPLEGNKAFLKNKVFADIQEGIDAGFVPISYNPLDLVYLKMAEMDKYISAHTVLQDMASRGVAKAIKVGDQIPDGYKNVQEPYGIFHRQVTDENGKKIKETWRYVVPTEAAQVFNNYLSQNLYNNKYVGKLYRAYMAAANALNSFQLGLSAFHAGFTSFEAVISHGALGVKSIMNGDLKGAAKYFKEAPLAWINIPRLGGRLMEEIRNPGTHPELSSIAEAFALSGGRLGMDNRFYPNDTQKAMQDWASGRKALALARSPLAVMQQAMRPIMEGLVPRQKLGVFTELMQYWDERNPTASFDERRASAQQIMNRVDSRLGQVNYDRLFIHNVSKNLVQALIRAPGWTGGTILEIGGGLKDLAGYFKDLALHAKDPGKFARPVATDRMAYTLSMLATTAIANGLLTALFTGDTPDGKDLLAFRTGKVDEKGNPERFMLPTYMKDVYAYASDPLKTISNKTHPLLSLAGEEVRNKDYYGTEIRHEGDNIVEQTAQTLGFGVKAFVPFWMRGTQKEMERGGDALTMAAPLIGIMPAPSEMNMTPAQKTARDLTIARMPVGTKTQAETDRGKLIGQLTNAFRNKDPQAMEKLNAALAAGQINRLQAGHITQNAKQPPLVVSFKRLNYDEAQKVMEVAKPDERKLLIPFLKSKMENYYKNNPVQQNQG